MARGGSRYGAGRPAHKVTAESVQRVDVRLWARRGYFDARNWFSWSWNRGGEPSGSITVRTTSDSATLSYRIRDRYSDEWTEKNQVVPIVPTPCNYGGNRKWFHCPVCSRRCELLFLRASRFACRHCQMVAYTSQSGGPIDRLTHKLHKLRARTEGGKPRGMRWATYERLVTGANDIEEIAERQIASRCFALFGATE